MSSASLLSHPQPPTSGPITRLPVDLLLYIASLRFLSLNDIVQWRTTATIFYNSIPLPSAAMILEAAYLFQVRPRSGAYEPNPNSTTTRQFPQLLPPSLREQPSLQRGAIPTNIHSRYKGRQLQEIIDRLSRLLTHVEFQPRIMRCSYSFQHYDTAQSSYSRSSHNSGPHHSHSRDDSNLDEHVRVKKTKRTRRDLQDYPIFVTGNPPDLVRLAIEFGHIPFVDHLLSRGFRPRDLPEYHTLVPFLPMDDGRGGYDSDEAENPGPSKTTDPKLKSQARSAFRRRQTSLMKRSIELNQIWQSMRSANQELLDACSNADLERVRKVLDATLVHPRISLDGQHTPPQPQFATAVEGVEEERGLQDRVDKGSLRIRSKHGQLGTESKGRTQPGVVVVVESDRESDDRSMESLGAGVGGSTTHQAQAANTRDRASPAMTEDIDTESQSSGEQPQPQQRGPRPLVSPPTPSFTRTSRSMIFQPRKRVKSDAEWKDAPSVSSLGGTAAAQDRASSTLSHQEPQLHMPWVDGRALTSALLAVCFRRDGFESPEAETIEESLSVPIVREILKYDSMLTAQSLGQAVLGVAYSRPNGSLKRAQQRRQHQQQQRQRQSRQEASTSSSASWNEASTATSGAFSSTSGSHGNSGGIGVMDLLLERVGPREWLKLIKCYLQRREFDDLAVVLERCPFKGTQLEDRDRGRSEIRGYQAASYQLQPTRELIAREAGICGMGTRLNQFTGRGIGQASYHVSSTLHESSRTVFTGSGTRFSHGFMLPRGGFRGIGGTGSMANNGGQVIDPPDPLTGNVEDFPSSLLRPLSTVSSLGSSPGSTAISERGYHHHGILPGQRIPRQHHQLSDDVTSSGNGHDNDFDGEADTSQEEEDEVFEGQDSNLALGGIGSCTTSYSRPGPGIAGIAIQVQAPDSILQQLFKMGLRFYCVSDLSISDSHHPMALQFRQQERINRLLIEFCMVPNFERFTGRGGSRGTTSPPASRRHREREASRHTQADKEYHAQVVQRFLYPATMHSNREYGSNPAISSFSAGASDSRVDISGSSPIPGSQNGSSFSDVNSLAYDEPASLLNLPNTFAGPYLTPSNRIQFILPPMQLGESFESIANASVQDSYDSSERDNVPIVPLPLSPLYYRTRLGRSMPLPIRNRNSGSSFIMDVAALDGQGTGQLESMYRETVKRRIRDCLRSDFVDLMTIGICLYQACFHQKEYLLDVLLEHRHLVAQDALAGAVQVAASVGWKRGLELLLVRWGDVEAELEPVVTTTSDLVHLGTSMKWDHATAERILPAATKAGGGKQGIRGHDARAAGSARARSSSVRGVVAAAAEGLESMANRGLRRHQSDGGRVLRPRGGRFTRNGNMGQTDDVAHVADGSLDPWGTTPPGGLARPASLNNLRPAPPPAATTGSTAAPSANVAFLDPVVIPTARSSSLRYKRPVPPANQTERISSAHLNNASRRSWFSRKIRLFRQKRKQPPVSTPPQPEPTPQGRGTAKPEARTRAVRSPATPTVMLSTEALWSLPSSMMVRRNRNSVVALMATVLRNDPELVQWLVDTFSDIKMAHLMQALMIACDRGQIRVAQVLVGGKDEGDRSTNEATNPKDTSRDLFQSWLRFQRLKVLGYATNTKSGRMPTENPQGDTTETQGTPERTRVKSGDRGFLSMTRENKHTPSEFDTYPFLFLMESSPLFRHYYQTLNTLSSCQFMTQVVGQDQTTLNYGAGAGVAANGNSGGLGTGATGADSSSRMWHQRPRANRGAGGRGAGSSGIESVAENRRVPNIMRQTPAEIKSELIRVMLEPIFEVFGPIAVRKAIDRIPNDCWWPLDPDVRAMIDVTARKRMVHIALEMKRQQKLQQQMQRQQRLEQQRQQQRNKGRETKSEKTQQKRQQSPTEVESKEKESEKEKVVKVTTQDPSSQQQQQREQKEKMRQEEIGLDPEMEALRRQNSRHRSESQSRRSVLLDRLVRRSVVSSSGVDDLFDFTGETQGINSDSGNDELVEKDNTPEIPTADHLPKEEGPHWRRVRKRASAPWRSVQRWMTRQRSEPMMEPNIDFMSEVEVEERFGIVIEGENESSDLSVSKSIFRKMRRSTMMVEK